MAAVGVHKSSGTAAVPFRIFALLKLSVPFRPYSGNPEIRNFRISGFPDFRIFSVPFRPDFVIALMWPQISVHFRNTEGHNTAVRISVFPFLYFT